MIIDTHCHYNIEPLLADAQKHWQNSLNNNVVGATCIGTSIKNSKIAIDLSQKFKGMFATIAIHPEEYTNYVKSLMKKNVDSNNLKDSKQSIGKKIANDTSEFKKLLNNAKNQNNDQLVAIGEIGLDYYRLKAKGLKRDLVISMQQQIFLKQLTLAFKHQLPVILHVRDQIDRKENNAYYDTFKIVNNLIQKYKTKKVESKETWQTPPIILHCASGPIDHIKNFLDLGAYIGFAGNITYTNAPELKKIFKLTPKNKVLLETDAPYLAPNEKKGELCEPYLITKTAEFLQNNYQLDLDIIIANTLKVFPQFKKVITY